MFVPVMPIVPNTTIVNKTILYSDTVLNIKEKGINIQVSSIDNVEENELTKCLKTIFENNKEVMFHTVQYSKNDNRVYFYTDKEINTSVWEESNTRTYKQFKSTEILEEIKNILKQEVNKDEDVISLYQVSCLMKEMKRRYESLKDNYNYSLENGKHIIIYDFDYKNNELKIGINSLNEIYEIRFSKQDGDLFITKSEYYNNQKVLNSLGQKLSILYDEFMEFKDFEVENSYGVKTVNSIFYANVCSLEVSIFNSEEYKFLKPIFNNGFEITSYSYSPNYGYECNSVNTLNVIKSNEDELFKRIFVKIEDMPKWCQSTLYEMRKEELNKKEEKQKCKSLKERFKNFMSRNF